MKHLYIRIDDDLHARVKDAAGARGISMNQFVVESLRATFSVIRLSASVETNNKNEIIIMIDTDEFVRVESKLYEIMLNQGVLDG